MGSASVLEDHILLAKDLKLLNDEKYHSSNDKVIKIKKMLSTLISKLIVDCYYAPLRT
jgi:four helix bundle protein